MSRNTFISYRGRDFGALDVSLGVFLKYLIDAAESGDGRIAPWLSEMISSWRVSACICDVANVLDDDWTEEQRRVFIGLAEVACEALRQRTPISAEEMKSRQIWNGEGIEPRSQEDLLTEPVVELGRAIIALISGDLPEAPDGTRWFYGEQGRKAIKTRQP